MLVGSVRGQFQDRRLVRIWNSLEVIDGDGRILASYDKAHLVPFGEYMPLPAWISLAKVTAGSLDFTAGPGPRTLTLAGLPPVGPLICYEVIFPAAVVDRRQRPDWLLNLTNDGWYGISSGPYQHLVAARMRAVEEGLPLVRAANSGISAVIDPYGRVVASLGLGQAGVLDADLPRPIGATLFARAGWLILPLLLGATALAAAVPSLRHRHDQVSRAKNTESC
jgi:apolipoprotein N-acyltransferase